MPEIAADPHVECCICHDQNNNTFYQLVCGHGAPGGPYPMHKLCLRNWFTHQRDANPDAGIAYTSTCPVCRALASIQDIEGVMP
jgi:hypothetical protein